MSGADPSAAYRLPYGIEPHRYDLLLRPDLESASFKGEVRIGATAHDKASEIVLNAADLVIDSAVVTDGNGGELSTETMLDAEAERLTLVLPEPVEAGDLSVALSFTGTLNDQLHGFYRSTYTDPEGSQQTIATTQFEATDARRAFPCFDEPDRKAVFSVTVDVPDGLDAFSNGPVVERTPLEDGRTRVRFGDTMKMSSYLVALVVGPLVATDPVDVDGIPVRVVHVPGKEKLCDFALEVASHALRYFASWFDIPYPAEKLDLLAIPDFAFGAMENLGCVTFREVLLLADRARASRVELERIADVVSHELAHMWFGDLVTMKWWNGIWLNEAFATFMEIMSVEAFRPEWQRWVSFGLEREAAMATDALHSTRPVEYPVGPPEEAQGMFDVLTYQKGAGVLRMLQQYVGEDRFRDGVRRYLERHSYANTETSDLWDALEEASEQPVRDIMDTWIFQGGFPVVSVSTEPDGTVLLDQRPFAYSAPPPSESSAIGSVWQVPVVGRQLESGSSRPSSESAQTTKLLLSDKAEALVAAPGGPVSAGAGVPLLLVNAWGDGYYRVRYAADQVQLLAQQMHSLDSLERANLIGDTWASAVAGHSELDDVLRIVEALAGDEDPDVWTRVTNTVGFLHHALDDSALPALASYTRALAGPAFEHLSWQPHPGEGERTPRLRAQLITMLGVMGQDPQVRAEASRLEKAEREGQAPIDADIASAVTNVVASWGTEADYEAFLGRYRNPATPQEESRYRAALACFGDQALAERTFELATTEVRTQDTPYLVLALLSNRSNGAATWKRLRDHWDDIVARIPSQTVPRMLEGTKTLCRDEEIAKDIRRFLDEHPVPSGQRTVEQILERLAVNVAFSARLAKDAASTLEAATRRLG